MLMKGQLAKWQAFSYRVGIVRLKPLFRTLPYSEQVPEVRERAFY